MFGGFAGTLAKPKGWKSLVLLASESLQAQDNGNSKNQISKKIVDVKPNIEI
jgi:hypothetical protein